MYVFVYVLSHFGTFLYVLLMMLITVFIVCVKYPVCNALYEVYLSSISLCVYSPRRHALCYWAMINYVEEFATLTGKITLTICTVNGITSFIQISSRN